jgi:hypothetical protein
MFPFVSPKVGGSAKASLVIVLMMGASLEVNSNFLATVGEEPSPASDSCSFGNIGYFLVIGFFGVIVLSTEDTQLGSAHRIILDLNLYVK